ncbi:MAG TPA: hypothetical protein PLR73_09540 [Acetivibrio sp.]|nr:hypothetical protein [Acetivibrio sp.]
MKRLLLIVLITFFGLGCSGGNKTPYTPETPKTGVIELPYEKPVDFKQFEVYISKTANFDPTGWDGSKWLSQPNSPGEWNGIDKTLYLITYDTPIVVTGLTPGVMYYVRVVVVDRSNQRSIPSPEQIAVAQYPNVDDKIWRDDFDVLPYNPKIWMPVDEYGNIVNNTAILASNTEGGLSVGVADQIFQLSSVSSIKSEEITGKLICEFRARIPQPTRNFDFKFGLFYYYTLGPWCFDASYEQYQCFAKNIGDFSKIRCYSYKSGLLPVNNSAAVSINWGEWHVFRIEYTKSTGITDFYIDNVKVHSSSLDVGDNPRAMIYVKSMLEEERFVVDFDYFFVRTDNI